VEVREKYHCVVSVSIFFPSIIPYLPVSHSFLESVFSSFFFLWREKREEGGRGEIQKTRGKYLESRRIFAVLGIAVVLEILQGTDYDLRQRFIFALPHPLFLFLSFFIYFTLLWVGGIEVEEKRSRASQARTPGAAAFQRFGGFFFNFGGARPQYFISILLFLSLFFRFLFLTLLLTPTFSYFFHFFCSDLIPHLTFHHLTAYPIFRGGQDRGREICGGGGGSVDKNSQSIGRFMVEVGGGFVVVVSL